MDWVKRDLELQLWLGKDNISETLGVEEFTLTTSYFLTIQTKQQSSAIWWLSLIFRQQTLAGYWLVKEYREIHKNED